MVGWIILAVLAVLILLVFFLPYGVDVGYADEVLRVGIKAGPLRIWLLPKKPLTEKQKAKKEERRAAKAAKKAAAYAATFPFFSENRNGERHLNRSPSIGIWQA